MRHRHRLALAAFLVAVGLQTLRAQPPGAEPGTPVYMSNGLPIGVPETTGGIYGEPLQRYDAQFPWLHGYFQEVPPYSGYAAFRPYNYKHVLSQAQAAGGWGESPTMPYAQQFWHRYRQRARMLPPPAVSETDTASPRLSTRSQYRSYRTDSRPPIVSAGGVQSGR
jgi:hypothetical protein